MLQKGKARLRRAALSGDRFYLTIPVNTHTIMFLWRTEANYSFNYHTRLYYLYLCINMNIYVEQMTIKKNNKSHQDEDYKICYLSLTSLKMRLNHINRGIISYKT